VARPHGAACGLRSVASSHRAHVAHTSVVARSRGAASRTQDQGNSSAASQNGAATNSVGVAHRQLAACCVSSMTRDPRVCVAVGKPAAAPTPRPGTTAADTSVRANSVPPMTLERHGEDRCSVRAHAAIGHVTPGEDPTGKRLSTPVHLKGAERPLLRRAGSSAGRGGTGRGEFPGTAKIPDVLLAVFTRVRGQRHQPGRTRSLRACA
jgi:hypothetical protein